MRIRRSLVLPAVKPPATMPVALAMSSRSLGPGRNIGAHEIHGRARLIGDEFIGLEIDGKFFRFAHRLPGRAGEIADHRAVLRRVAREMHGAGDAAGARDVLGDDAGIAVDMAADVFGEQAAFDVGRSARLEVDDDRETLVFVIGLGHGDGGRARRGRKRREQATRNAQAKQTWHASLLSEDPWPVWCSAGGTSFVFPVRNRWQLRSLVTASTRDERGASALPRNPRQDCVRAENNTRRNACRPCHPAPASDLIYAAPEIVGKRLIALSAARRGRSL